MPKHQGNLSFGERDGTVYSHYDLDGQFCCRIEVDRPRLKGLPLRASAANFCAFRGMLFKSRISFKGRAGVNLPFSRTARLMFGDHPRMAPLKGLTSASARSSAPTSRTRRACSTTTPRAGS